MLGSPAKLCMFSINTMWALDNMLGCEMRESTEDDAYSRLRGQKNSKIPLKSRANLCRYHVYVVLSTPTNVRSKLLQIRLSAIRPLGLILTTQIQLRHRSLRNRFRRYPVQCCFSGRNRLHGPSASIRGQI